MYTYVLNVHTHALQNIFLCILIYIHKYVRIYVNRYIIHIAWYTCIIEIIQHAVVFICRVRYIFNYLSIIYDIITLILFNIILFHKRGLSNSTYTCMFVQYTYMT